MNFLEKTQAFYCFGEMFDAAIKTVALNALMTIVQLFFEDALRDFQILGHNPGFSLLWDHIDTKNGTMLCNVITPLKKDKNFAFPYKVTVWELTKVKGRRHYIVTSMGVKRLIIYCLKSVWLLPAPYMSKL